MTRVATSMISQTALFDLQRAQTALFEASGRTASQNKADDMKGYGTSTQNLLSSQRLSARLESRIARAEELNTRMTLQDTSLQQAADMVSNLRQAVTEAVGLNNGDNLDLSINQAFIGLKDAFNANLNGRYLFGGTLNDSPPVNVNTLADLGATAATTDAFEQDTIAQEVRIDAVLSVDAAPLAKDVAQSSFDVLRTLKQFSDGIGGFTNPLTAAQKTQLQTVMTTLDTAYTDLIRGQGQNGQVQGQIDSAISRQTTQLNALDASIGDITEADLAEVAMQLNQAELSYQASASVFNTLRGLSLLDVL